MVLTGPEIYKLVLCHDIIIDPFDLKRLNPNSYNLRLADTLVVYEKGLALHHHYQINNGMRPDDHDGDAVLRWLRPIDMATEERTAELKIPPAGLILWPGIP